MPFRDLRQYLTYLDERGDLLYIRDEVDPKQEIAAYIRKTSDTGGPALFFEKVKGFDMPVVGGIFGHRRRVLMALESTQNEVQEKFVEALAKPLATKVVSRGVCQDVVLTGAQVDLTRLPIPTFAVGDGGPYITLGMVIANDPDTGVTNAAIRRLQLKGRNRLGIQAHGQLAIQQAKAEARDQALEVAIAIGCAPVIPLINQCKTPYGVDELAVAGALCGEALEVVRCCTVNLAVPATSEVIIEGQIPPRVREMEGPFGEVTGYQTPATPKQVIEVTAITHRQRPIFQTVLTGVPTTEHHVLKQFAIDAAYYAELKSRFPGVVAVHFPGAGAGGLITVVAMKQHAKYEARNVIAHMLGTVQNKLIIVVDEDIDLFNIEHVMWAVATRCRPEQDVIIYPRLLGGNLDPSAQEIGTTCGLGFDATRPFGEPFPAVTTIAGVERVPDLLAMLERQQAVRAD